MPKYEFSLAMSCEGCSNAAKRNLAKIGVEDKSIEVDMEGQKIYITTDKSEDDILEALKKTGKETSFVKKL